MSQEQNQNIQLDQEQQANQQKEPQQCEEQFESQMVDQLDQQNQEPQYDQQVLQDDQYDQPYDIEQFSSLDRIKSLDNAQYQLKGLTERILKQAIKINDMINIGVDWSIMLFYACGWKPQLCEQLILEGKQRHLSLINYDKQLDTKQVKIGKGQCCICGQDGVQIFRNVCKHQFCCQCWKQHFMQRLRTQYKDPFPPCMYSDCPLKMSYQLCRNLGDLSDEVKTKFEQVLCRSYASYSKYVKICNGKPGITCNKCFAIQKMMGFIQCETCGNFLCPRCGQQFHGSCQCFILTNWKRLTEDSTEFIQQLGYKICPYCKQVVERKQGCNSMICKCKQQFCYVCGQKWLPNHKAHGDQTCPKYKQIQILNQQKKKKKQQGQKYYQKIQQKKSKLDIIIKRSQRVEKFKKDCLPKMIDYFLSHFKFYKQDLLPLYQLCTSLQNGFGVLWGQTLILHFKQDQFKKSYCKLLEKELMKIYDFIFEHLEKKYRLMIKKIEQMTPQERVLTQVQKLQKFQAELLPTIKELKILVPQIQNYIQKLDNQA